MVNQWRNTKIKHKPYNRYNPSISTKVAAVYLPWLVVSGALALIVGVAICITSVLIYVEDSDIKTELFHIWVGVPLLVLGVVAFIAAAWRNKVFIVALFVVALIIAVLCAMGAIVGGVRYWTDGWDQLGRVLHDKDICAIKDDSCVCTGYELPINVKDCADAEQTVDLLLATIALDAVGFISSIILLFLSMMSICCAPWMYTEWYEEQHDPDFSSLKHAETRNMGKLNPSYGNGY